MPKEITKNQRYVNSTGRTGVNPTYTPIKTNTFPESNDVNYINGVQVGKRQRQEEYDWSNDILGRMLISVYMTYLKLTGKLPILTKAEKLIKENKLERESQNV
jgi:hypothetical protein